MDEVTSQQVVIEDLTENDILSEDLVLDSQGIHTLNSEVADGTAYDFAVKTQPADQTCTFVGGSSGTVSGSEIALELDCTPGNTLCFALFRCAFLKFKSLLTSVVAAVQLLCNSKNNKGQFCLLRHLPR